MENQGSIPPGYNEWFRQCMPLLRFAQGTTQEAKQVLYNICLALSTQEDIPESRAIIFLCEWTAIIFCLLLRFYFLRLHLAPMKTAAAIQDRWFWTFPNVAKSGDVLFVQHVVQSCMKQFSRMVNSLSTRFLKGFTIFWLAFLWAVLKRCSTSHTRQWLILQLDSRC